MPTTPITLSFSELVTMADAAPDKSIIVKDGGFKSVGKLGAFFASKTDCRLAAQAFMDGIKMKYGDAVAYTLAPELRALKASGKPLSAHKAKDLLRQAKDLSQGLTQVNADMAEKFIKGSGIPGDPRTLDAAFDEYCQTKGLNPQENQELKMAIGDAVRMMAKTSGHMLSFAELCDAVRSYDAQPDIIMARQFCDALNEMADAHELTADQKAGLTERAFMAASSSSPSGSRPTALEVQNALQNDLSVQCYLYACGASIPLSPTLRDYMTLAAGTPQIKDAISLVSVFGDGFLAQYVLAMQKLPEIRALQPEGIPTNETIWQACFDEPLPANLAGKGVKVFKNAMNDRLNVMLEKAAGGDKPKAVAGIMYLSTGLTLERSIAAMTATLPSLGMDDFVLPPKLNPVQDLPSLDAAEATIAKDLRRRGDHGYIEGYSPVITFGRTGQAAQTVHIRDLSGLDDDEKQEFKLGHVSPVSKDLVAKARALCGGNDAQLRQVVLSMGQSGCYPMRELSSTVGVTKSEHSPIDIDIRRQDDGSILMRYHTPENSPLDIDYTFTVATDGQTVLTDFHMQPRQAAG
ncbi:MAG: hypothetical protein J5855_01480 [Mailhella sp.]|nr:hypothetical protein [Mailhella sp.]